MSHTIIWSPDAESSFEERLEYLRTNWTEKEIVKFKKRVKEYFEILKEHPRIGKRFGKRKDLHIGLILKPVSVIYRVKTVEKEIELVLFIDNRRDPKRIKKYDS